MNTQRQLKFSRLIQKELGEIFQRDTKNVFGKNDLISVTEVRVSPDLGVAKIFLSFILSKNKEEKLQEINEKKGFVRNELGIRIRHQARIIPELIFYLDEGVDYAQKMDSIINKLNIPPAAPEEEK